MIYKEDIAKLAELARIEVNETEMKSLAKDIEAILSYVEQVKDVSVANDTEEKGGLVNVFRADSAPHESGIFTDALISAAPEKEDGYVKVKKIL